LFLATATANADLADMRGSLFQAAEDARAVALAKSANVLAPLGYDEGVEAYAKAQKMFDRSGSVESIRRTLSKAENHFNKSAEAAEIAASALDSTIQARRDATSSDAKKYAEDEWEEGEIAFSEATRRLERGSISSSQRYAEKAESAYREAELIAIKANYLDETRDLIRRAQKLRAERYAPVSLANAQSLLETAESELNSNRYDTDRPRSLAVDAKHAALHAIYVATLDERIRDRETNLEAVLLEWEQSITQLGDALDKPLYFDFGEKAAINELLLSINAMQQENERLGQNLNDRDSQVTALNEQVSRMQQLLGGGSQTIEELERLLAQQARHKQRFAQVETMFPPEQATVLRQGDTVIIRMIGLNFDSGAADLKTEHMTMLNTLRQAIEVFPDSSVVVEGHTDAFGSDETNHTLSQTRAEAVVHHLLEAMPISPTQLTSVGYGESRPVANNETAAGRKRNRRIDVVIRPSWVTAGRTPTTR
jgi:outer membrane protein OmpA-like peptidoglycan-associated protein